MAFEKRSKLLFKIIERNHYQLKMLNCRIISGNIQLMPLYVPLILNNLLILLEPLLHNVQVTIMVICFNIATKATSQGHKRLSKLSCSYVFIFSENCCQSFLDQNYFYQLLNVLFTWFSFFQIAHGAIIHHNISLRMQAHENISSLLNLVTLSKNKMLRYYIS